MSDATDSKQYPSQVVAPTKTDSVPQQGESHSSSIYPVAEFRGTVASTQPGDGSEVRMVDQRTREELLNDPNVHVVEVPAQKVPFKDQVIGYAQVCSIFTLGYQFFDLSSILFLQKTRGTVRTWSIVQGSISHLHRSIQLLGKVRICVPVMFIRFHIQSLE